ncbi:MAG: hypothetical protein N7Q72_03170, partial [Spiroplasma sp. Tabriz.8]|nr:hypothetical protein [Spiroplasma sp. Tabriz.8]
KYFNLFFWLQYSKQTLFYFILFYFILWIVTIHVQTHIFNLYIYIYIYICCLWLIFESQKHI